MEDQYQDITAYTPTFDQVSTTNKKTRVKINTATVIVCDNVYTLDIQDQSVNDIPFEDIHELSRVIKEYFE